MKNILTLLLALISLIGIVFTCSFVLIYLTRTNDKNLQTQETEKIAFIGKTAEVVKGYFLKNSTYPDTFLQVIKFDSLNKPADGTTIFTTNLEKLISLYPDYILCYKKLTYSEYKLGILLSDNTWLNYGNVPYGCTSQDITTYYN